jgi:hypothetical protein
MKNNIKFYLCHDLEYLRNASIEELDYEKHHDLACIEDRQRGISLYLGVYDDEFCVTLSLHNKEDFDDECENMSCIDMIPNWDELEKQMKDLMEKMLEFKIIDVTVVNGEMLLQIYDIVNHYKIKDYKDWYTLERVDAIYGEDAVNKKMREYGYLGEE